MSTNPKGKMVNRRFNNDWLSESWAKGWLQAKSQNSAYCAYCHTTLRIHYTDLKKHALTKLHVNNAKTKVIPKKETVRHFFQDLLLTMFILNHTSIRAVDHLGEFLGRQDTSFSQLRLHRTKCSCLIKSVISPCILRDIVDAVGNQRYSIILDESTDISVNKYLAVLIRYFNETTIVNDFLGLIEVERATAVSLHASLVDLKKKKNNLPLKNMLALGTDGGSNLCGKNNSVYTLLRDEIPDLILLKCVCHSIHLSVSKASEELPSSLDFLAYEVYNWFSNSPLRRIQYERVFNLINIGEDKVFRKFVQLSATRWLCRYNVIQRIVEHWLELKTFFQMAGSTEKCYKAKTLAEMLRDDKIWLYLKFLLPILQDMNNLNLLFQKDNTDIGSAYLLFQKDNTDIGSAYLRYFLTVESLARRLIKPTFLNKDRETSNANHETLLLKNIVNCIDNPLSYLPVEIADLGNEYLSELKRNKSMREEEKSESKQRCFNFLIKLLSQLIDRLPSNLNSYKSMRLLSAENCLNERKTYGFGDLPILPFILTTEDKNQWRKLPLISWKDEFNGNDIPTNLTEFWSAAYSFKNGAGDQIFKELATVVLRMLSLPTSNAAVERAFSIMNNVKTKLRNRMKLDLLEAVMRIKIFSLSRGQCCLNFNATDAMLAAFNSNM